MYVWIILLKFFNIRFFIGLSQYSLCYEYCSMYEATLGHSLFECYDRANIWADNNTIYMYLSTCVPWKNKSCDLVVFCRCCWLIICVQRPQHERTRSVDWCECIQSETLHVRRVMHLMVDLFIIVAKAHHTVSLFTLYVTKLILDMSIRILYLFTN